MKPDVGAAHVAAFDEARADELEILLELARNRDRFGRIRREEVVSSVGRAPRGLQGLEILLAPSSGVRGRALPTFEKRHDRNAVDEQAGQLFGGLMQEAVLCRAQVEIRI